MEFISEYFWGSSSNEEVTLSQETQVTKTCSPTDKDSESDSSDCANEYERIDHKAFDLWDDHEDISLKKTKKKSKKVCKFVPSTRTESPAPLKELALKTSCTPIASFMESLQNQVIEGPSTIVVDPAIVRACMLQLSKIAPRLENPSVDMSISRFEEMKHQMQRYRELHVRGEQQLKKLRKDLTSTQTILDLKTWLLECLSKELRDSHHDQKTLTATNDVISSYNMQLKVMLTEARESAEKTRMKTRVLSELRSQVSAKYSSLEEHVNNLENERNELSERCASLTSEICELKKFSDSTQCELDGLIHDLVIKGVAKVTDVNGNTVCVMRRGEAEALNDWSVVKTKKDARYLAAVSAQDSVIATLTAERDELEATRCQLEAETKLLFEKLMQTEASNKELSNELQAEQCMGRLIVSDLEKSKLEISSLKESASSAHECLEREIVCSSHLKREVTVLRNECSELEDTKSELVDDLADELKSSEDLEDDLDQLKKRLEKVIEKKHFIEDRLLAALKLNKTHESELALCKASIDEMKVYADEATSRAEASECYADLMKCQVEATNDEADALRTKLATTSIQLSDEHRRVTYLRSELVDTRAVLNSMTEKCEAIDKTLVEERKNTGKRMAQYENSESQLLQRCISLEHALAAAQLHRKVHTCERCSQTKMAKTMEVTQQTINAITVDTCQQTSTTKVSSIKTRPRSVLKMKADTHTMQSHNAKRKRTPYMQKSSVGTPKSKVFRDGISLRPQTNKKKAAAKKTFMIEDVTEWPNDLKYKSKQATYKPSPLTFMPNKESSVEVEMVEPCMVVAVKPAMEIIKKPQMEVAINTNMAIDTMKSMVEPKSNMEIATLHPTVARVVKPSPSKNPMTMKLNSKELMNNLQEAFDTYMKQTSLSWWDVVPRMPTSSSGSIWYEQPKSSKPLVENNFPEAALHDAWWLHGNPHKKEYVACEEAVCDAWWLSYVPVSQDDVTEEAAADAWWLHEEGLARAEATSIRRMERRREKRQKRKTERMMMMQSRRFHSRGNQYHHESPVYFPHIYQPRK